MNADAEQKGLRPDWVDDAQYPFGSQWLDVGPGRLHYVDEGPRDALDTLLFVHGNPDWSFAYRHVIRALSSEYRCVAVDHLGFGLSDKPSGGWNFRPEDHAAHMRRFVEALDLRGLTLVMNDWGGPFALPLAVTEPERIRRLVAINTTFWSIGREDRGARVFSAVMGGPIGRYLVRNHHVFVRVIMRALVRNPDVKRAETWRHFLNAQAPDERRASWSLPRQIVASARWFDQYWAQRASLADKPMLVIWGERDPVMPKSGPDVLRREFPQCEVVRLAEAGHYPHEDRPAAVATAIARFISRASPIDAATGRQTGGAIQGA